MIQRDGGGQGQRERCKKKSRGRSSELERLRKKSREVEEMDRDDRNGGRKKKTWKERDEESKAELGRWRRKG